MRIPLVLGVVLGVAGVQACSGDPSSESNAPGGPGQDGGVADGPEGGPAGPNTVPAPGPMNAGELAAASARPAGRGIEVFEDPTGNVVGISGRLARNVHANDEAGAAASWLEGFGKKAWGWTGSGDVALYTGEQESYPVDKSDPKNQLVVWQVGFVQLHDGVPIETREGVVTVGLHTRDLAYVTGGYVGNLGPDPVAPGSSSTPGKTVEAALTEAAKDPRLAPLNLVGPNGFAAMYKGRLVWSQLTATKTVLAYRVLLDFANRPSDGAFTLLVDASSGALLEMRSGAETNVTINSPASVSAPRFKGTSPTTVAGSNVFVSIPFGQPLAGTAIADFVPGGTLGVFYASGPFDPEKPYLNNFVDDPTYVSFRHATDAYEHTRTTFTWLKNALGWVGVDGAGTIDLPLFPFSTTAWNASADPRGQINLHSGIGTHLAPASVGLSVMAHEIGHQIVRWVNPLDYKNESGALNEAIADFQGNIVRGFPGLMADDVDDTAASAIRNLADPTKKGHPDRYLSPLKTPLAASPDSTNDNGGVHSNSGIINKAHWLMIKGSKGAAFQGFEVAPMGDTTPKAIDAAAHLVYSALFAGSFPSNCGLPAYGAGLYGFCRAQTAMWKGLALATDGVCGSVHDALQATDLIGASNAPTDITLEGETNGEDSGKLNTRLRVYNVGTARYDGPVRFDLRADYGVTTFDTYSLPKVTYQPKSKTDLTATFAVGSEIAKNLPYDARLTVSIAPGVDGKLSNNTVTLRLWGEPVPAGSRSTILTPVAGTGGVHLSVARDGNFPFKGDQIGARLLYRKKGTTKFVWGAPATSIVREHGDKTVPYLGDLAGITLFAEPLLPEFVAWNTVRLSTWDREIVTVAGDSRKYGVLTVLKDQTLRTTTGAVVDDDLVFVAFNYDGRLNIAGSETLLYCLNCDAVDPDSGEHFEFTGVTFQADTKLGDILPADLASAWSNLAPISIARPPVYMRPGWPNWLKNAGYGPGSPGGIPGDPSLILKGSLFKNAGP